MKYNGEEDKKKYHIVETVEKSRKQRQHGYL
jgi:hypothetical protein